jgi:hypothetical protein
MKTLFEPAVVDEVKARLRSVRPESIRQWGKMNVAQAMAHLANSMEMAVGDLRPPRVLIGRVFGPLVRRAAPPIRTPSSARSRRSGGPN